MSDKMKLWNAVSTTIKKYTKDVKLGSYEYTSINPTYQIGNATEQWGPFGSAWGVKDEAFTQMLDKILYTAIMYYPDGDVAGEIQIHASINLTEKDFAKKVATDALTKGLSKLGFNADIFKGEWDTGARQPENGGGGSTTSGHDFINYGTMIKAFEAKGMDNDAAKGALNGLLKDMLDSGEIETRQIQPKGDNPGMTDIEKKKVMAAITGDLPEKAPDDNHGFNPDEDASQEDLPF